MEVLEGSAVVVVLEVLGVGGFGGFECFGGERF